MNKWLCIAGGGAIGSILRYGCHAIVHRNATTSFPLGTFLVNVVGCLLIGFLVTLFAGIYPIREEYRLGIIVGILGGFTTFSAFGWETFDQLQAGQTGLAALYVALSCGLGLLAVWLGSAVANLLFAD